MISIELLYGQKHNKMEGPRNMCLWDNIHANFSQATSVNQNA